MANRNNSNDHATITGTAGNYNVYNSGAYSTITLGTGDDTIDNLAIGVKIYAGGGNDGIYNNGNTKVTVEAGTGDDTINNYYSSYTVLRGDAGNDLINLVGGNHITVEGGEGSDTIIAACSKSSIYGFEGDDIISIVGSADTVIGGTGNDTLTGSRYTDTFLYTDGDGNDVIINYGNSDRIKIVNGEMSGASIDGNDVILFVGSGSLTIQNAVNKQIKLIDDYMRITYINPTDYLEGSINQGSIRGSEINDVINNGNNPGGYNFGDNATIEALGGNDKITNRGLNVYINAGAGNDTIDNNGSGTTIIGASGNDSIRTKGSYVNVDSGEGNDYIYNYVKSENVTLTSGAGNDRIYNYGANAIVNSGSDDDYIINGAKGAGSALNGGDGDDKIRNAGASDVIISGGAGDDSLCSSNGKNVTINGGTGDDTIRVTTGYNLIQYASGDGDDVIYGYKTTDTIQLTSGSITDIWGVGADLVFFVGDEYIQLKNVKNKKITIADSNGTVTSQVYDIGFPTGIRATNKSKTYLSVDSEYTAGTLDLNVFGNVKNVDASQSDCSLAVIGNDMANVFKAGSGGGTLEGGKGNDILYCNSGADMMIYSKGDGNDVIYNYESGQDSIKLSSDVTVSKVTVRGKDVTVYFEGGGSIKVRDGKGKAITIDENGSVGTYTFNRSTTNGLIGDTVNASTGDADNIEAESSFIERLWFAEDYNFETKSLDSLLNLSANAIKNNSKLELSLNKLYNTVPTTDIINGCSASIGSFSDP